MTLKELARRTLPAPIWDAGKRAFLAREARALRDRCRREATIDGIVDRVLASQYFRPDQKKQEITQLLRLLRESPPHRLCEIGGRMGGSLAMFAQVAAPDAQIMSIDLEYKPGQKEALAAFAGGSQRVTCIAADSHLTATAAAVKTWLKGERLDFLLIDGDHSLEGARSDFLMYAPFVRPGGLVAFHDVVADSLTRTGVPTGSYAGGVPILWQDLKSQGYECLEFVENWQQDGFGIGVIRWDGRGPTAR
jgi:cephalosporin hydroxylase